LETWLPFLLKQDLACIALHGRTFKQLYHGKADWQAIARAKEIVDSSAAPQKPLLLGNGDIASLEQAKEYCEKFNLDGVLIGRAFLGIPWLLNPRMDSGIDDGTAPAVTAGLAQNDLFAIILEHSKIQEDFDSKNFVRTRKHLAWYCKGFEGASALRQQLVLSNNFAEVKEILQNFLTK
jgi:tRNA-dihydrouridine synthase